MLLEQNCAFCEFLCFLSHFVLFGIIGAPRAFPHVRRAVNAPRAVLNSKSNLMILEHLYIPRATQCWNNTALLQEHHQPPRASYFFFSAVVLLEPQQCSWSIYFFLVRTSSTRGCNALPGIILLPHYTAVGSHSTPSLHGCGQPPSQYPGRPSAKLCQSLGRRATPSASRGMHRIQQSSCSPALPART